MPISPTRHRRQTGAPRRWRRCRRDDDGTTDGRRASGWVSAFVRRLRIGSCPTASGPDQSGHRDGGRRNGLPHPRSPRVVGRGSSGPRSETPIVGNSTDRIRQHLVGLLDLAEECNRAVEVWVDPQDQVAVPRLDFVRRRRRAIHPRCRNKCHVPHPNYAIGLLPIGALFTGPVQQLAVRPAVRNRHRNRRSNLRGQAISLHSPM